MVGTYGSPKKSGVLKHTHVALVWFNKNENEPHLRSPKSPTASATCNQNIFTTNICRWIDDNTTRCLRFSNGIKESSGNIKKKRGSGGWGEEDYYFITWGGGGESQPVRLKIAHQFTPGILFISKLVYINTKVLVWKNRKANSKLPWVNCKSRR